MRIGFFGNANNYPFSLARILHRMGHDVQFIVDRKPTERWEYLNRPENSYHDIDLPYPKWIHDVSPVDLWAFPQQQENRSVVLKILQSCDAVVLNEFGLVLGKEIGRPYIALLTGTDLEVLADYRYVFSLTPDEPYEQLSALRQHYLQLVTAQREGICNADVVLYFPKGLLPKADILLTEIGVTDEQRIGLQMTDLSKTSLHPPPDNQIMRVFNVARVTWKKPEDPTNIVELDYKGTDIMIRGLGTFVRRTGINLDIRLVRKGIHIEETMHLIQEEGLTEMVCWQEEMSQQQVMEEYRQADIVFEQLGQGMIGMGAFDAMAMGRPVIANGRPEIMEQVIGVPSPLCQAATPEEVYAQLVRLVTNRDEYLQVATASRAYVETFFSTYRGACLVLEKLYRRLCNEASPENLMQHEFSEFRSMLTIQNKMNDLIGKKQKFFRELGGLNL